MRPLVSVITPTTHDRAAFNERMLKVFAAQDYPNKEHLVSYEDVTLGQKMNKLCAAASGEIILNIDSDDTFAPDWITKSVDALLQSKADIVGLKKAYFYDYGNDFTYAYTYPPDTKNIHGGTMCHTKEYWRRNPYISLMVGYDHIFCNKANTFDIGYSDGFIATIHKGNVSPKNTTGERWAHIGSIPTNLRSLLALYPPLP